MMDENAVVETAKDAKAVSSQGSEAPSTALGRLQGRQDGLHGPD